jgi:D-tyrosyl-tRNA(Tyr) deacylase
LRAVVQRVVSAQVTVDGEVIGSMEQGLLALVGVGPEDSAEDTQELARKMAHLRVFPDDEGVMNRSLLDVEGSLGIVSQFTLFGDLRKGRRPYYGGAAAPEKAEALIEQLVEEAKGLGLQVMTGRFGASMQVSLTNDGPVTLLIDTEKKF